jgi:hypothetical protein
MQHPTEVGSEHERLREVPRAGIRTAHMEVFYLGETAYVHLFVVIGVVIKSGDERVFLGGIFWVFLRRCEKNRGSNFFIWTFAYVVWYI